MKILLIIFFCLLKLNAQNFEYESKDIIIHHKDTSKKTIVIWGGISYATPKWMEKQIPKKILDQYNVLILSYKKDLKSIKEWYFQKYQIRLKPNILMGFSRGGLQPEKELNGKYEMVCLLDPILNGSLLKIQKHKNTVIIFNTWTWDHRYSKKLMSYGKHICRNSGTWKIEEVDHKNFPTYFFKTFF